MRVHRNDGLCVCVYVRCVLTKCNFRSDYSCPLALSVFANKSALKIMVFFVAREMNGEKYKTHIHKHSHGLVLDFSTIFLFSSLIVYPQVIFLFFLFDSLSLAYFASFDLLFCRFFRFVKL